MPALSHSQGLNLMLLGTHQPTPAGKARGAGKHFLALQERQSDLSAMTCVRAWRREQSRRSSNTAGHFLGIVTKAHDCGEEDPRDLA